MQKFLIKPPLASRQDIEFLVQQFYLVARQDPEIGYIFDYIPDSRWQKHLDKIYRFWASLLLDEQSYDGNPMLKHKVLHQQIPMTHRHFDVWLQIWTDTVNQHFEGGLAEQAILRGKMIKEMMANRVVDGGIFI